MGIKAEYIGKSITYSLRGYRNLQLESSDSSVAIIDGLKITFVGRGKVYINVYDTSKNPRIKIKNILYSVERGAEEVGSKWGMGEFKNTKKKFTKSIASVTNSNETNTGWKIRHGRLVR